MPSPKIPAAGSEQRELVRSVDALRTTMETVPNEYGHLFHPGKHLFYTYIKGIVYGLGALTAVAIIIPLLVWFLQQVQWVPLVGDFLHQVLLRIEETQTS